MRGLPFRPELRKTDIRRMGSSQNDDAGWRAGLAAAGLALAIPWLIGIPAYIGWYLDKRYGTWPVWFIVFLLAGLVGTALDIYKLLRRFGQLG